MRFSSRVTPVHLMLAACTLVACSEDETAKKSGGSGGAAADAGDAGQLGGAPTTDSGAGGSSGSEDAGRPAAPPGVSPLGFACGEDADCPAGTQCLTSDGDELGGGAPHGYCSAVCENTAECDTLDEGAICLASPGGAGYCVQGCFTGSPGPGEDKCKGRPDVACTPVQVGRAIVDACIPFCGSDADCGDRFCDYRTGFCVDDAVPRPGVGAQCDPTETDPCLAEGVCLPLSNSYAICTQPCVLGTFGCGFDPEASQPGDGVCWYGATGAGLNDPGFCGQLCAASGDCTHPGAECRPISDADLEAAVGQPGYCAPTTPALDAGAADGATGAPDSASADSGTAADATAG